MAVTVTTHSGTFDDYENATGWHVDDDQQLHVFKKSRINSREADSSTSLGSYASGAWAAVSVRDEVKMA